MSKVFKTLKSLLALSLSLMMVMSLCSVSAATTISSNSTTTGVLWSEDFEGTEAELTAAYSNSYRPITSENANMTGKAYDYQLTGSAGKNIWLERTWTPTGGKTSFSFDLYFDTYGAGVAEDDALPGVYHKRPYSGTTEKIEFIIAHAGYYGVIDLNPNAYSLTRTKADNAEIIIEAGTKVRFEVISDYDNNTVSYLVDGEELATSDSNCLAYGTGNWIPILMKSGTKLPQDFVANEEGNYPNFYIDNLCLEILEEEEEPEITLPRTLYEENFDGDSSLDANVWKNASNAASVSNNVLNVPNGAYPILKFPNFDVNATYEFSYDVKSSGGIGSMRNYGYKFDATSNSMNMGGYHPGKGFSLGTDMNTPKTDISEVQSLDTVYTVKIRWCYAYDNTFVQYSVLDAEDNVLMSNTIDGFFTNAEGELETNGNPLDGIMFWATDGGNFTVDNILLQQVEGTYSIPTTIAPRLWAENKNAKGEWTGAQHPADSATATGGNNIIAETYLYAMAYAPVDKEAQLIIAGYAADGTLQATKVYNADGNNRKVYASFAAGSAFDGVSSIRLFWFDGDLKPITVSTDYTDLYTE